MSSPYGGRSAPKDQRFQPCELPESGGSYVYFLGHPTGKFIRIGHSKKPNLERVYEHDKEQPSGEPNKILAIVRGTPVHEEACHTYFAAARTDPAKKSWYHRDAVIGYVTWLRDHYFVSTSEEEFWSAMGNAVIESGFWLPKPERVSSRRSEQGLLVLMDPWGDLPSRNITGDDYYTPPEIMAVAHATLGEIDLDPASHVHCNWKVVHAKQFYTESDRGELKPWYGRVWLNPPFSKWSIFVEKTLNELPSLEAIMLLAATRTMTAQYFAPLLERVDAIGIITGRFAFWGVTNASAPPDGHFLMYYGREIDRFKRAMQGVGTVFRA